MEISDYGSVEKPIKLNLTKLVESLQDSVLHMLCKQCHVLYELTTNLQIVFFVGEFFLVLYFIMEKSKEVFVKTQNISEKNETEKLKERLHTHKEKRRIIEKLKNVKSLADEDDDEDAAEWYSKMKRIQEEKELAKKQAKLLEEMDQEFDSNVEVKKKRSYTNKDLKGLAIGHKADSFKEGHQIVLTLRDNDVLNDDEDVLENVNMLDDEKAAKNVDNKHKKPDYKPYDDDEFDEFGILKKSSLLSKYDEEIEGPKKDVFRIGRTAQDNKEIVKMKLEQQGKVTLQLPELKVASEYYTPTEMLKFKKPKRKGALRKKVKNVIKEEIKVEENDEIIKYDDHGSRSKRQKTGKGSTSSKKLNINLLDIDKLEEDIVGPDEDLSGIRIEEDEAENELQSALCKARKLKLKDNIILNSSENIAKMIESIPFIKKEEEEDSLIELNGNNIILNSTAEFCRNLGELPTYSDPVHTKNESDTEMEYENNMIDEIENEDGDTKYRNNWNEVDIDMDDEPDDERFLNDSPGRYESQPILEEEPDVSVGVAGALKLAMNKGYLDKETVKPKGANRASSVISAQAYAIEEKF